MIIHEAPHWGEGPRTGGCLYAQQVRTRTRGKLGAPHRNQDGPPEHPKTADAPRLSTITLAPVPMEPEDAFFWKPPPSGTRRCASKHRLNGGSENTPLSQLLPALAEEGGGSRRPVRTGTWTMLWKMKEKWE